jgi:hypothetical protein
MCKKAVVGLQCEALNELMGGDRQLAMLPPPVRLEAIKATLRLDFRVEVLQNRHVPQTDKRPCKNFP